ncbi:lactonase family protein [Daejeonella oryzae]|uniref:lactonase family protein n=1 Tax=Daejeonella oryzae TaxID=1122943 RepID=UPI00047AAEF8|nr:lactonase family protein [Daejeonella oryzae]
MKFTLLLFLNSLILLVPAISSAQRTSKKGSYNLLIGTYTTTGKSEGIYIYHFNSHTGEFKFKSLAKGVENPSYLCISENQNYVYAVNELGKSLGSLSSFSFNSQKGELTFLNKVSSMGDDPCYISIDKEGKHVFAGNYSGGNLSVFNTLENGSLTEAIQTIQHTGNSINTKRQEKAHVHSTVLSPDEKMLFAADLGTDKINSYSISHSERSNVLTPSTPVAVKAGSGPRHLTFHPKRKFAYLIHELTAEISVYDYQEEDLKLKQTISMLDSGFNGAVGAADIHISGDGKFLYASNRGDANELVIYSIAKNGELSFTGRQSSTGKTPRNFGLTPDGKFLLVANQNSDEIVIFKRNKKTGLLSETGKKIAVGAPVCLLFAETR